MKSVEIRNISLRIHGSGGLSHIEFHDNEGEQRLGRILPSGINTAGLDLLYERTGKIAGVLCPDGITKLPDDRYCISIRSASLKAPGNCNRLTDLLEPLQKLHSEGINHLSIDEKSFFIRSGQPLLVFWGDGMLQVHSEAPREISAGGIPSVESDLYMFSSAALKSNWLSEKADVKTAEELFINSFLRRRKVAASLGYINLPLPDSLPGLPKSTVSTFTGGDWRTRDLIVNHLCCLANGKGWACRVIRCASGEIMRSLPDVPPGTVTTSPGELLRNAFSGQCGIDKLLIVNDLSREQEDLTAILLDLVRIIPSGLRIVLCGSSVPAGFPGSVLKLQGSSTAATDIPFTDVPAGAHVKSSGPSWYGPRCRVSKKDAEGILKPFVSQETLFAEGAWRATAFLSSQKIEPDCMKAESLFHLGRYGDALESVPASDRKLRSRILMAMGRYDEAVDLLEDDNDISLIAHAYLGQGNIQKALEVLNNTSDPRLLPLFARLHDLSGSPASAVQPLKKALPNATGTEKVDIYCALRGLEMRLGIPADALKHAEAAVDQARNLASIPHLVQSLQERGRTLQVTGKWRIALEDFRTAVQLHDERALSFLRPPHVDLFVLELKMGRISQAKDTLEKLTNHLETGGIPARQMLNMLKAYMGVLSGSGEKALPYALKAAELASQHNMELYRGISILYAGQLYIQAGNPLRGIELAEQARSVGHILGDRHLVCLAEIEILLERDRPEHLFTEICAVSQNLQEEYAASQIISGDGVSEGFEHLLDLPSPFLACRLAEKCGFPDDPELGKRIINWRGDILNQLLPSEQADYEKLFKTKWTSEKQKSIPEEIPPGVLEKVSCWITEYLEGEVSLPELSAALGLDEVSLFEKTGMIQVPGAKPLYCRGDNALQVAQFLEPVAAVLAARPAVGQEDSEKDHLSRTIIGGSREMKKLRFQLERIAGENVPVLISGETGTGKELFARAVHLRSERRNGNFVPVDCGAIPESLMESEFFGAAPGAYTGSGAARKGLFEEADGGTLFLDEIGNLPLMMQAKLLRVLDTGTFRRLGETRERTSDIRLIAATNSDVESSIVSGTFRNDLYYRISVVRLHLPPLRERISDIPELAKHFTGKLISAGALELLAVHRWPGNIRELSNVIRRAAIESSGNTIQKSHITFNLIHSEKETVSTLRDVIRLHIQQTVKVFGGNRSKAAKALECDPKTLRKYLS